jgi:hypothetical protein
MRGAEIVMLDGVLEWAKKQRRIWIKEIKKLEAGKKTTFEVKHGRTVGTSSETLKDMRARLKELDGLITRNGEWDV